MVFSMEFIFNINITIFMNSDTKDQDEKITTPYNPYSINSLYSGEFVEEINHEQNRPAKIMDVLDGYDKEDITIATLGSHSSLHMFQGAKTEGFRTAVVCEKGRKFLTKGLMLLMNT